jgi:hypothetical protein
MSQVILDIRTSYIERSVRPRPLSGGDPMSKILISSFLSNNFFFGILGIMRRR